MLDQNTDRMWYVIGAVIVGATIIFIANGTMPDLFASVTGTFEESAGKATNVIEDITPLPIEGDLILRAGVHKNRWINPDGSIVEWNQNGTLAFYTGLIEVEPGSTIRTYQPIGLDQYTSSAVAEYGADGNMIQRPWNRNVSEVVELTLTDETVAIRYAAKSMTGGYDPELYGLEIIN